MQDQVNAYLVGGPLSGQTYALPEHQEIIEVLAAIPLATDSVMIFRHFYRYREITDTWVWFDVRRNP